MALELRLVAPAAVAMEVARVASLSPYMGLIRRLENQVLKTLEELIST